MSTFFRIRQEKSYTATEVYTPGGGPHKVKKKDWEDEDPVGQWDTPVGEPLIMLVMAVALLIGKVMGDRLRVTEKSKKQDRL